MFRKTMFAMGVLLVAGGLCLAQQSAQSKPEVKKTAIKQTSPASGKAMFAEYCAACHGADGKGNGPAASAMKAPVADLTQLAKSHGGKYPANLVAGTLKFGNGPGAHGSADMPVWGPLFQSLDKYSDTVVQQRINNLVSFIDTLQTK